MNRNERAAKEKRKRRARRPARKPTQAPGGAPTADSELIATIPGDLWDAICAVPGLADELLTIGETEGRAGVERVLGQLRIQANLGGTRIAG
jgi:hypothetical protein